MTNIPESDPLADLLAAPSPVDAETLRQSLLAQTTRQLHRPRRLRFAVLAAALAACYGAGLLTMYLLRSAPAPAVVVATEPARPADVTQPAEPPVVAEKPTEPANPAQRAALLRQQGDRFLNEENDPESALHSYTKALNAGSDDDAKFSPDDNWLLMAIKNAREKEDRNANTD